tara:strand:+ start:117 stop:347 length:231 start_codon:yes stop_codon:yes gene_type:complete
VSKKPIHAKTLATPKKYFLRRRKMMEEGLMLYESHENGAWYFQGPIEVIEELNQLCLTENPNYPTYWDCKHDFVGK